MKNRKIEFSHSDQLMRIQHKVSVRYAKVCLHSLKTIYNYRGLNFNNEDILVDVEIFDVIGPLKLSAFIYPGSNPLIFLKKCSYFPRDKM